MYVCATYVFFILSFFYSAKIEWQYLSVNILAYICNSSDVEEIPSWNPGTTQKSFSLSFHHSFIFLAQVLKIS